MTAKRNAPDATQGHSEAAVAAASESTPERALISDTQVQKWHRDLMQNAAALRWWTEHRGVPEAVLRSLKVGRDFDAARFTFPVYDADGVLVDVKRYKPGAQVRKNIHTKGYGSPCRLFGADRIAAERKRRAKPARIWITGGEPDALKLVGLGLLAVSGTSGEGSLPRAEDLELLRGRDVVVCLDQDGPGRRGAAKWVKALLPIARSVRDVEWPESDGKDVTDWLNAGHRKADLLALVTATLPATSRGQRSIDQLVEWAINTKLPQCEERNRTGFELACQLRDNGYLIDTAKEVLLEQYLPAVTDLKDDPYTPQEVDDSVESAYSMEPREPSGSVELGGGAAAADGEASPSFPHNDAGNADMFLAMHRDDVRHVREIGRNGKWLAWTGRGWAKGDAKVNDYALDVSRAYTERARALYKPGDAKAMKAASKASDYAVNCGNDHAIKAMLRQAALRGGVEVPLAVFDADPTLLPFRNGTVVLGQDGVTLREHQREDYCMTVVDVDYVPGATSPQWEAFLDLFLPDPEVCRFVQKLAGYSLFGANTERLLIFLIGLSSTGKSTFIELLARALGPGITGAFNLSLFRDKGQEGPRPDVIEALSRRIVHTSEASTEWKLHADSVKRMTGGDTISARGMVKDDFVQSVPRFTPWVVTNHAPTIEHADPALWRRLVAVPFDNVVPATVDNAQFRSEFPAGELAGVVAWAVAGWDLYRREGVSERPAAVRARTEALQRSLSTLDQFLDECCEFAPVGYAPARGNRHEYMTPFASLYQAYCGWWSESGHPARDRLATNKFGEMLEERGYLKAKLRDPNAPRTDDRKVTMRVGLRLDPDVVVEGGSGAVRFTLPGGAR